MKLGRLVLFGAGYLLGTKAGRERYEQLVQFTRNITARLDAYNSNSLRGNIASAEPESVDFYDQERP